MGLLVLGIGLVGAVVGFMIGASNSPVVGAAIPVVFGVITAALAVFGKSPVSNAKELVELSKYPEWKDEALTLLNDDVRRSREAPVKFGAILVVFAVLYAAGLILGIQTRLNEWLLPEPETLVFPWEGIEEAPEDVQLAPTTVERALEWVTASQSLRAAGYSDRQIRALYEIELKAASAEPTTHSAIDFPWADSISEPRVLSEAAIWIAFRDYLLTQGYSDDQVKSLYGQLELDETNPFGVIQPGGSPNVQGGTVGGDLGSGWVLPGPRGPRPPTIHDVLGPFQSPLYTIPVTPEILVVPYRLSPNGPLLGAP